ncbi:MAG: restriction endonuclease subunit S [Acinetobacter sp. CAG:196_36_41]|nr:MAG: restriction endonuclease subunit S [Acinetobacter sp. CAG:196_36_41]
MQHCRKFKDSGLEWIGDIPEDWGLSRLKSVLAERKEKNDPVKTEFILSLGANYGVIPYAEKDGGGNKAKEDYTQYKLAYPNDIVMNSMNIVSGSVALSKYYGCVSPVYYMFYPRNSETNIRYYNYIFQTRVFQRSLVGLGNGIMMKESSNGTLNTVRMRIPAEKLNALLLPIPSLSEQEKIANFLDEKCSHIDSVLKKTRASIEEYRQLKQSVITKVVTKGIRPNRPMKNSGIEWIGDIPEDWMTKKLRYLGSCQNGISKGAEFFGSGYPFISYSNVYRNIVLPEIPNELVETSTEEREVYSVKRGDVFFTRTSETIEEIGFTSTCCKTIPNATFAGFVIRFRPYNNNLLLPEFSKYYFRSNIHRAFFVKEMNLVTRASLGQGLLKRLPVLIPEMDEQLEIVSYLDTKCAEIDKLIEKKELLLKELETYKKSLIYEYVTGKKEVL